ncbi:SPARC-related modular calcium-binding protein 1-like isoform X20 [Ostrea edulis]|uniref:SPARC-related modular calcium-binding protein 1-like isoform X20 n=1 Tax=Ostrea edulis TaxID=37623 RepID=UPI0024AE908F|nr:SPARC-related modular calcium-binding protein 1-like isoform X20 [Ostrea edulis]
MYRFLWIITCLVVFLTVIAGGGKPTLSRTDIQAEGKNLFRALSNSNCKIDCSRKKNRPVCGSDGVTYKHRCELKRAKRCDKKKVKVKRKGPCSPSKADRTSSNCVRERSEALEIARRPTFGVYIPECKDDGTKKRRQPKRERGKSKKKKRRKSCKTADKQKFNMNIVKVFTDEYQRAVQVSGSVSLGSDKTLARKVIEWKFDQLDKNKDNILKRRETRTIKRMVRKLIQPKACARRFLEYCDSDRDKMIKRKEWSFCLATNTNTRVHRDPPIIIKPTRPSPKVRQPIMGEGSSRPGLNPRQSNIADTRPEQEVVRKSCLEEHASSLSQQSADPNGGIYIPQCTSDGKYNIVQCHKYCWCVNQDTGIPLKGIKAILASKGPPQCNITAERAMPGCPFVKKSRFLTSLLSMFVSEMRNDSTASQRNPKRNESDFERAARWKFRSLDKNNNTNLDRREVKKFRKLIPKQKDTRKCSRNFLRYCDENTNKKISLDEWLSCTKLSESPRRKGKNPLREYLKPS